VDETPFAFAWSVDQDGYEILRDRDTAEAPSNQSFDIIKSRGGPLRFYRPLDTEGLWLRFAQSCTDAAGAILFATEFGLIGPSLTSREQRVDDMLETAARIRAIWKHHEAGAREAAERWAAIQLFNENLPSIKTGILWLTDDPRGPQYRFIPLTLRDALLHQAGEAITGNRRFRHCRNPGCPNWFRLGRQAAGEGGNRQTITARREFCSDRCRVASARRKKKEGHINA
jgi:hypothetical protein